MFTLLIGFFVVAIVFSFLCSLWEAVLLSVTPTYARIQLQDGVPIGKHLDAFKANIDRPLAAILTLNTIAHTVGAIGVGNQAALIWTGVDSLMTLVVIPVGMTLGILILSEIVPKTLGATHWRLLVPFTVTSLRVLLVVLAPIVWVSQRLTRLLKRKDESKSILSRSDFLAMAEIGAEEGVFRRNESVVITNLLRFDTVRASDVMTPRTVLRSADETMTIAAFYAANPSLPFARVPIYKDGNPDHVTGFILRRDLLTAMVEGTGDQVLSTLRRDIEVIPKTVSVPHVFEQLLEKRAQIALVVDEFGGVAGLVTLEDVIETLLGLEIVDELDNAEDMQKLARRNWEKRAQALGLIEEVPIEAVVDDKPR